MSKPIIEINLDTVINQPFSTINETIFGNIRKPVKELINVLKEDHKIVVTSERKSPGLVQTHLEKHDVYYDEIHCNKQKNVKLIIDSRNLEFSGDINEKWIEKLKNRTTYNPKVKEDIKNDEQYIVKRKEKTDISKVVRKKDKK